MAKQPPMPEPPDSAALLWAAKDADDLHLLVLRDDSLARLNGEPVASWFYPNDLNGVAMTWPALCAALAEGGYDVAEAIRLYPQSEVDRLVAEAKAEAGLIVLGDHLIEPGGYCRTHGSRHSPEEIARIEDRLAEEPPAQQLADEMLAGLEEEAGHA